jgi:hypothetical protein
VKDASAWVVGSAFRESSEIESDDSFGLGLESGLINGGSGKEYFLRENGE